jgi:hypothetical protein
MAELVSYDELCRDWGRELADRVAAYDSNFCDDHGKPYWEWGRLADILGLLQIEDAYQGGDDVEF